MDNLNNIKRSRKKNLKFCLVNSVLKTRFVFIKYIIYIIVDNLKNRENIKKMKITHIHSNWR